MAMIACSRCRKQISSEATACRHCGRTFNSDGSASKPRRKRNFAVHYLMSMVLAVAGAAIYISAVTGTEMSPYLVAAAPVMGIGGALWYVAARIMAYIV